MPVIHHKVYLGQIQAHATECKVSHDQHTNFELILSKFDPYFEQNTFALDRPHDLPELLSKRVRASYFIKLANGQKSSDLDKIKPVVKKKLQI